MQQIIYSTFPVRFLGLTANVVYCKLQVGKGSGQNDRR